MDGNATSFHWPFKQFVIACSITVQLFSLWLDLRQKRALDLPNPPAEMLKYRKPDMEEFKRVQKYSQDKWWFGFCKSLVTGPIDLGLLYWDFLPYLWGVSSRLVLLWGASWALEVQTSICFCLLLGLVQMLLDLPWSYYSTFVIEQRHGFNKQTRAVFVKDFLKSVMLSLVLGPPLIAAFTILLQRAGTWLIPGAVGFFLSVQLLGLLVYPTIAGLFNKFEPLPQNELRQKIEELASSLKFPLTKLFVVDGSTRSAHSNAYFFGLSFLKNMRIVLFDTLIDQCSTEEIIAVLAHELGHWRLNHILKNLGISQLTIILQFALFESINSPTLSKSFGFVDQPALISFILFSYVIGPVDEMIGFLTNVLSRMFEFEADEFAAKLGFGEALKRGLLALDTKNKSAQNSDFLYTAYHSSHPQLSERLAAIDDTLKKKQ